MTLPTALLLCPGRGSYGREELGFLARQGAGAAAPAEIAAAFAAAERGREAAGELGLRALDGADRFRPGTHLQGVNAAELIYFGSLFHLARLSARYRIVAVAGNSLGWYTALAAAGALSAAAGHRLVRTMAGLQLGVPGAQILTTTVDEEWRTDPAAAAALAGAITAVCAAGPESFVGPSIRLGGHEVLAGTAAGIADLLAKLPRRKVGGREFPFQLAGNGPFHTPLCAATAVAARDRLADLEMRRPHTHLIDGRGNCHSPWSADPASILEYTVGAQVVETFDFTAAVRTGIREFLPDVLLCAGPGSSLRAPAGHVVIAEGYRGIGSRSALFDADLVRVD